MITQYFLGSNSGDGFYSLYDGLFNDAKRYTYVLKGGPGCGKSSFMRKISEAAEAENLCVEHIICSGDPDSLDGVIIPKLGVTFLDGTAPHVTDPILPGVRGRYIDLSGYYLPIPCDVKKDIEACNAKYKAEYRHAYAFLAAAKSVALDIQSTAMPLLAPSIERARLLADSFIVNASGASGITGRFLDAYTCKGQMHCPRYEYGRRIGIRGGNGIPAPVLQVFAAKAAYAGADAVIYYDPLIPSQIRHIDLPGISLSVSTEDEFSGFTDADEVIKCPSVADTDCLEIYRALIKKATVHLKLAHETHDVLERLYNPYVDFSRTEGLCRSYCERLFI